jgi:hypothetical protein
MFAPGTEHRMNPEPTVTEFCLRGHRFATEADWRRGTYNHRPWPGTEFEIAECRNCNSTVSWPPEPDRNAA